MRKQIALFITVLFFLPSVVFAQSNTYYQEYLREFDKYRTYLNEFKIARTEYLKFKTLTSEEQAFTKTKAFVAQRSYLLRSYLVFLQKKLEENTSMTPDQKTLYGTLLGNEIQFLANQAALSDAIGSIADANGVSQQLTSHFGILLSGSYQTIVALKVADLKKFDAMTYDLFTKTSDMINANRSSYTTEKLSRLERWLRQIQDKRSLFQQKIDEIEKLNTQLKSNSSDQITTTYQKIVQSLTSAKQYEIEAASYLKELTDAMQYKD